MNLRIIFISLVSLFAFQCVLSTHLSIGVPTVLTLKTKGLAVAAPTILGKFNLNEKLNFNYPNYF